MKTIAIEHGFIKRERTLGTLMEMIAGNFFSTYDLQLNREESEVTINSSNDTTLKNYHQSQLDLLPSVVIDIITDMLSPKDLLILTSTSRRNYQQGQAIWRSRCRKDGFACIPGKEKEEMVKYDEMGVNWKRVYFCYESRCRRRIDHSVKWIVDEVAIFKGVQKRILNMNDVVTRVEDDSEEEEEEGEEAEEDEDEDDVYEGYEGYDYDYEFGICRG
ncbi:hypothetical protein HDU76_000305 [Blyttiomyces sp. JEL0837]|nr:hypothetical protein HDU76_000305 [Blyttiomyces sp. JEL0837]